MDNVVDVFVEAMKEPVQGINSYKLPFRLKINLYSWLTLSMETAINQDNTE